MVTGTPNGDLMTIHARLPILLIAIALGAAEPSPAAPPAGQATAQGVTALAEAQRLQAARDPRAAIPLYTQVIERDPADIIVSAPALSGLIACHQMLVGDAQQAEAYRTTVGRWLEQVPPLDGKTVPAPKALREELLWAPVRKMTWRVDQISSGTTTDTNENTTVTRTYKHVTLTADVSASRLSSRAPTASEQADATMRILAGGRWIEAPRAYVHTWKGDLSFIVEWEDVPGVKRLDCIKGFVRLRQPLEVQDKEFPLVKGTELSFVDGKATLSDVERDGDRLELMVEWKRKMADDGKTILGTMVGESDPNEAVSILLMTADGKQLAPVGQGSGGGGSGGRMRYHRNLTFKCDDKVVGVVRTVTAWSYRDVPVLVENIDLTQQAQP